MLSGSLTPVIIRRVRFEVVTCPVYPSLALLTLSGLFGLSLAFPLLANFLAQFYYNQFSYIVNVFLIKY